MSHPASGSDNGRARGKRAEDVASWYFRLNGFFSIPGFVVHLDSSDASYASDGSARIIARTEADLIAVRFPFSKEIVGGRPMQDAPEILACFANGAQRKPLFILVEVKASLCQMNGPWTNSQAQNMQRVLRRLGFAADEQVIQAAATDLFKHARWEGRSVVVQYICVGGQKNEELSAKYDRVVQIDWRQIGQFLFHRFCDHPEKTPSGFVHDQWPCFGQKFGTWFVRSGRRRGEACASDAVEEYVHSGTMTMGKA